MSCTKIEFIELYPFDYLLIKTYSEVKETQNSNFYIDEFKALSQLTYNDVKEKNAKRGDISGLTNFINDQSLIYAKIINKNNESKNKFLKLDTRELTESLILKYANDILQLQNHSYPVITELTNQNELLLNTFDKLLREVSKTGKKIEDNDWTDIFNLIYVGNEDLYWTKEKSKQKLIVESELEGYLFENSYC